MPTRLLIHTRHRHGDSPSGTNTPQQRAHPVSADAAAGAPAAEMGWSPETARGKRGLITTRRRGGARGRAQGGSVAAEAAVGGAFLLCPHIS